MHFLGQNYKKQSHIMMTLQGLETLSVVTAFMVVGVKFFLAATREDEDDRRLSFVSKGARGRKDGSLFNSATRNLAAEVREICPLRIIRQRIKGVICRGRREGENQMEMYYAPHIRQCPPLQRASSSLTNPSQVTTTGLPPKERSIPCSPVCWIGHWRRLKRAGRLQIDPIWVVQSVTNGSLNKSTFIASRLGFASV